MLVTGNYYLEVVTIVTTPTWGSYGYAMLTPLPRLPSPSPPGAGCAEWPRRYRGALFASAGNPRPLSPVEAF